jgi:nucleoside kinase
VAARPARDRRALDLLAVGHTNVDRIVDVPKLPGPDRTTPINGASEALGGPAANLARAAARRGVASGILSLVGPGFPERFVRELQGAGVDTTGLLTVPGARSPSCWIVEDGRGAQMTLIDQGAMASGDPRIVPTRLLERTRWFHLGTGHPAFLLGVKERARALGRPVSVDPAQEVHYRWRTGALSRLLDGAEILFGNVSEVRAIATRLRQAGPRELLSLVPLIVVTDGTRGVRAFSRTGELRVAAHRPRRVAHVTGAGDAFRGGFYAAWFAGEALRECLKGGTRAAHEWLARSGGAGRPGDGGRRP